MTQYTETLTLKREAPTQEAEVTEVTTETKTAPIAKRISTDGIVNINDLSREEEQKYRSLANSLTIKDMNSVSVFGANVTQQIAKYSNDFLTANRANQAGEVGEVFSKIFSEISCVNSKDLNPSKFTQVMRNIPVLRHLVSSVKGVLAKYDTIDKNVQKITKEIEVTRLSSLKDNNSLEKMFQENIKEGAKLDEYIIAATIKLNDVNAELKNMLEHQGDYDAYQISDMEDFKQSLEQKITDMVGYRFRLKQSLPEIRTVQKNNLMIANNAQTIITMTIPEWRRNLAMAVALHNQSDALQVQQIVREGNSQLVRANADMLYKNTMDAARATSEGVFKLEDFEYSQEKLIATMTDMQEIIANASTKRIETIRKIQEMSHELESKMTEVQGHLTSLSDEIKQIN